jgi:L-lactate dehydrogenase
LAAIADQTRTAGNDIIDAKGATYYGIGAVLVRIVRAILRDEHSILTISNPVPESMHFGDVSLSLPTIIDRQGVVRVLPVALNSSERTALEASAETVKSGIAALSRIIPL